MMLHLRVAGFAVETPDLKVKRRHVNSGVRRSLNGKVNEKQKLTKDVRKIVDAKKKVSTSF